MNRRTSLSINKAYLGPVRLIHEVVEGIPLPTDRQERRHADVHHHLREPLG